MTYARATYVPGTWVAVSAPGRWLLLDLPPDHDAVERCWALMSGGAEIDDVLDVLVAPGIRQAPSFALAQADGDGCRAVVRGAARVVTDNGSELAAKEWQSWIDTELVTLDFDLTSAEAMSGVSLPMAAGVTMATVIRVRAATVAPDPPATPRPESGNIPEPEHESAPPTTATEPDTASPATYDHLFGATHGPVERSSVINEPDNVHAFAAAESEDGPEAASHETATWNTPSDMTPTDLEQPSADEGLIDAVPWGVSPPLTGIDLDTPKHPSPGHHAVVVADTLPVELSHTVDRSALRRPASDGDISLTGPTVIAGRCPTGHLSPRHSSRCRVCGLAMPEQEGFEVPRPSLGMLQLSTGDVVTLDRGVYFGRAPEVPADETDQPHSVRLLSPANDISRTHARIELDGWHVFVTDLGSTNGTVVTNPGHEPERLRTNDPRLLENGALVVLADEVTVRFEVTP